MDDIYKRKDLNTNDYQILSYYKAKTNFIEYRYKHNIDNMKNANLINNLHGNKFLNLENTCIKKILKNYIEENRIYKEFQFFDNISKLVSFYIFQEQNKVDLNFLKIHARNLGFYIRNTSEIRKIKSELQRLGIEFIKKSKSEINDEGLKNFIKKLEKENYKKIGKKTYIDINVNVIKTKNTHPYFFKPPIHKRENNKGTKTYQISYDSNLYYLHKVFAETFIPNPNNYKYLRAKDGNFRNIKVDNLEWIKYPAKTRIIKPLTNTEHYKMLEYIKEAFNDNDYSGHTLFTISKNIANDYFNKDLYDGAQTDPHTIKTYLRQRITHLIKRHSKEENGKYFELQGNRVYKVN